MKLFNKKGFILVETLVVTLFVMTLFILVYQNLVPSIGEYETMASYDDVDSVYASNLFKENLLRYGNMDYIDSYLSNHNYLNITDCDNKNVYKNSEYCKKIKKSLNILEDDYIFITDYNVSDFRNEVKTNEFFDSGKLSNFKSYVGTVSDTDTFYDETKDNNGLIGRYRLFMTRTVMNANKTTTLKYVNLGIYDGEYKRYNMGEVVKFKPGTSTEEMTFYVLKNSSSLENTVTLILDRNIDMTFDQNGKVLDKGIVTNYSSAKTELDNATSSWGNVVDIRLLKPEDIYTILGSKIEKNYFNENTLFSVLLDDSSIFLSNGLEGTSYGYWMENMVTGNNEMAWTIQDKKIAPNFITDSDNIGVRPVIVVSKDKLK